MFLRLHELCVLLTEQLGPDAINGPEAMKRYRKAIEEMDPRMHEALNERVVEDELHKRKSTLRLTPLPFILVGLPNESWTHSVGSP